MRMVDLTGQRFGRLVVACRAPSSKGVRWFALCDCGESVNVLPGNLKNGHTQSCGCLAQESRRQGKHGKCQSSEYKSWAGMLERCRRPACPAYRYYGARGIVVCERWIEFAAFYEGMGPKPSPKHSIDRIDNSGNYEPGNCRWATQTEQANNKRSNVILTHDGLSLTVREWAERTGIKEMTLGHRISAGWPVHKALTKPVSQGKSLGGKNAQKARRIQACLS